MMQRRPRTRCLKIWSPSEMTGEALAWELRCSRPDMPMILCTGFSHVIDTVLLKPIMMEDLAVAIRQILMQRCALTAQKKTCRCDNG